MNKRGQNLSTTAIILIILGAIVLVVLALGFSLGWKHFAPFVNTGDNVQTVVTQCSTYCTLGTSGTYDYCSKQMSITSNGKTYLGTCNDFANTPGAVTLSGSKVSGTDLTTVENFKVASCPGISCSS